MKIKPALQRGHVLLDLGSTDAQLLARGDESIMRNEDQPLPMITSARHNWFAAEIETRANTRTHIMEEILSHHPRHLGWGINE